MAVNPVPEGFHSATPCIVVQGASQLMDFVKQAFDGKERSRIPGPGGALMHGEVQVGDSIIMMNDPMQGGPMPAAIYLYVDDVDATYKRAVAAGATSQMAPADMFWGDRMAHIKDPFGNVWSIATHKEDLSPEDQAKRAEAFFKKQ
ncbi:MAG: VOC family protein [Candidatus Binataceae bacterium]